ncbi:MAG: dicarboxylate/amino acid:cation symporter [Sphingomonadales bacterium]|nr:dicarboxylate/amino acid:cation symporter [Sphingomonadales bacterium]NCQ22605.1 dicarboxylate/amino acid:cation symporter [Sphingomonadales bacterium]NCT04039.1 dicarboxylate/amino acid:cation symporter [Sphingomonadales bacterium]
MKRIAATWFGLPLWQRILGALFLGALAGWLMGPAAAQLQWIGDLFIRLIRMLIVPLVFVTLVSGVASMAAPAKLGAIGLRSMALYMATTFVAILFGLAGALILQPGRGVTLDEVSSSDVLAAPVPLDERLMAIVPENVFAAFASGDILAIIFFGVLLGAGLLMAGETAKPLTRLFTAGSAVMLKVTHIVMETAPIGVFALVASVMGSEGVSAFVSVFSLVLVIYLGGAAHMILVHGGMVRLFADRSPLAFFSIARAPQLLAFSTSSSAATLPVTLTAAEEGMHIRPAVASSVIPLGATINMDGTALYVAAVAVFAAQIFGVTLSIGDYATIALTTVLVSIGTASVPSASLFLMAAVLDVIGITPDQTALVIGFLLPFDRILDMWRTVINVTGDLAVATSVAAMEGELGEGPLAPAVQQG